MKKISVNKDIYLTLDEFKKHVGDNFKHIPKERREEAILKEYKKHYNEPKKSISEDKTNKSNKNN